MDEAGVFLTFGKGLAGRIEWLEWLHEERDAIDRVVPGLTWEMRPDGKCFISVPSIPVGDVELPENRHRVVHYLTDQTNRMVNAFRHRLDTLVRQRHIAGKAD